MKIIVPTCQAYSDAWEPFYGLMRKFWPDNPYPVYLVTDHMPYVKPDIKGLSAIFLNWDYGWCKNILKAIEKVSQYDQEPILILQEDFFFSAPVDQSLINSALSLLAADPRAAFVRLMPCPGPDMAFNTDFGRIDYKAAYRISCQATIWQKDALVTVLESVGGTAIDFEVKGQSVPMEGYNFYCAYRNLPFRFPYLVSAISRGQWNPDAIRICNENNVPIDSSRRPIEVSK